METMYKRVQRLLAQGITVKRASGFEEARGSEGEKLIWVVDKGGERQATHAYPTKEAAIVAAEAYLLD